MTYDVTSALTKESMPEDNNKKRRSRLFVLFLFSLIAAGIFGYYAVKSGFLGSIGKPKYEWQKGMCYTTWSKDRYSSPESDASLKDLAGLGTQWVSILTTWYQDSSCSTKITPGPGTPSDKSVIHAIETAHALGMNVMLKPHLDILDTSDGSWRGEISCSTDRDWKAWFEAYRDFIVYYARIAREHKVEIYCIGTELTSVATTRGQMWKDIVIKPVRAVYKGTLTYAANWNEEYQHVKFWDALDYVGIDAYFPLTEEETPTFEEIMKGWEPWVKEMDEFQKTVNKPIIFPEVGYCSANWTAKTPWEEIAGGPINLELQANCYRAVFETFWSKEWFYGVYWWRWGTNVRFGGTGNRGYSPQNKPAKDVVSEWYRKPAPRKTYTDYAPPTVN